MGAAGGRRRKRYGRRGRCGGRRLRRADVRPAAADALDPADTDVDEGAWKRRMVRPLRQMKTPRPGRRSAPVPTMSAAVLASSLLVTAPTRRRPMLDLARLPLMSAMGFWVESSRVTFHLRPSWAIMARASWMRLALPVRAKRRARRRRGRCGGPWRRRSCGRRRWRRPGQ